MWAKVWPQASFCYYSFLPSLVLQAAVSACSYPPFPRPDVDQCWLNSFGDDKGGRPPPAGHTHDVRARLPRAQGQASHRRETPNTLLFKRCPVVATAYLPPSKKDGILPSNCTTAVQLCPPFLGASGCNAFMAVPPPPPLSCSEFIPPPPPNASCGQVLASLLTCRHQRRMTCCPALSSHCPCCPCKMESQQQRTDGPIRQADKQPAPSKWRFARMQAHQQAHHGL